MTERAVESAAIEVNGATVPSFRLLPGAHVMLGSAELLYHSASPIRYDGSVITQARAVQDVLGTVHRAAADRLGRRDARHMENLLRELIMALPHRNLMAASLPELQTATRTLAEAGRSDEDVALLQRGLVAFFDAAVRQNLCDHHPVREPGRRCSGRPTRALAVALGEVPLAAIRDELGENASVEVESSALVAIEMARWYPFREILVAYPLPSPGIEELMRGVRSPGSASRDAALVILAPRDRLRQAANFCGRGANRVVAEEGRTDLGTALKELSCIEPRVPLRVPLRVGFSNRPLSSSVFWQTENISATGVLARTQHGAAIGAVVQCEFQLPGQSQLLRGTGEVVRHTIDGRDQIRGVGLRFLGFEEDGRQRLRTFIANETE